MINHSIDKLSTNYLWKITLIKKYHMGYKKLEKSCNKRNSYYKLLKIYFKLTNLRKHVNITYRYEYYEYNIDLLHKSELIIFKNTLNIENRMNILKIKNLKKIVTEVGNLITINERIYNLKNLTYLNLNNNGLITISSEISKLQNLNNLMLNTNNLSYLPSELFNFAKLNVLDISCNKLREIPYYVTNLINLESLYANNNQIHYISPQIENLEKLVKLNISLNNSKLLPLSIVNLKFSNYGALIT